MSRNKLDLFILSTNDLTNQGIDLATLLASYKDQQGVERDFCFIKDPQFHLNNMFFEKARAYKCAHDDNTLCLMVYNSG